MSETWKHAGDEAAKVMDRVAEMKSPAVPGNVIPFSKKETPKLPDPRTFEYQDACGQFAEGLWRLCIRAEKDIGVHSVRGVVAAVLTEIDEQIEKDGGSAA